MAREREKFADRGKNCFKRTAKPRFHRNVFRMRKHCRRHVGNKPFGKEKQHQGNDGDRRNADEEIADYLVDIFSIIAVVDIAKRTVVGRDLEKLDFRNSMPEHQTHQRMREFVNGRADKARDITRRSAKHTHVFVKDFVANGNQKPK